MKVDDAAALMARPHQLRVRFLRILDASHKRFKVLSPMNHRGDQHARLVNTVDDAIPVDKPLAYGLVSDLRYDATHLGILRNCFCCFDDLGCDGFRIPR